MMRLLAVLSVSLSLPLAMAGSDSVDTMIMRKIDFWSVYSGCWGKSNSANFIGRLMAASKKCGGDEHEVRARRSLFIPEVHSRFARQASAEDEAAHFLQMFRTYKETGKDKLIGMKCFLQEMGVLDSEGNVDVEGYISQFSLIEPVEAAADPEYMEKLAEGLRDCAEVSESWPQNVLDRYEIGRTFGRQHIFVSCAKKVEEKMCYMYLGKQLAERFFGEALSGINPEEFGLADNKFKAAYTALRAKSEAETPVQKMIDEFMFTKAKFL